MKTIRKMSEPFRPRAEHLKTIEACGAEVRPEDAAIASWHDTYLENHKGRLAHDLGILLDNLEPGATLLEIGSLPLVLTAALVRHGFDVTGCDLAPERYGAVAEGLDARVVTCNVETEELPFPAGSFDAVVSNEIFEHLRIDPIFTMGEILRVLKTDGPLFLSSPNLRSLAGITNFLFRNRAYSCQGDIHAEYAKLVLLGHMGHVREYTTSELVDFLEAVGFRVSKLVYRGRYGSFWKRAVIRLLPCLRPFVTYVALKRAGGD